jgi:hypothetical protein
MNSDAPPEKGTGALPHAPGPLNPQLAQNNSGVAIAQVWWRWFAEAERIASEYHRSQNVRHLRAFCRMIGAIMQEIEKALPR